MAYIKISKTETGTYRLVVDDVDISKTVLADSVKVEFAWTKAGRLQPTVHLDLVADRLDLDLPEALLDVTRSADHAREES
ncbi:hypothetical protein F9L07_25280 [Pimelobacter simplex]|uniref:Uncharacterized protein n=1 Tax=Nocardioides simplex TaxID=2045 RepID=A0A7J5DSP3_NOCSI|nr:hypothetical protein [Pimelobacter simplex]KAB2807985.1 hypothetical protein F9L07_25280 [Pimelobacter simplex]